MIDSSLKRSGMARVTRDHTVLPAIHMFIHKWNEPYLPLLPSRRASPHFGWYLFPVPLRLGGWVGSGGLVKRSKQEISPAGFVLSWSTSGLLGKGTSLPLRRFQDVRRADNGSVGRGSSVMGHGSNGSTNLDESPLTHWPTIHWPMI